MRSNISKLRKQLEKVTAMKNKILRRISQLKTLGGQYVMQETFLKESIQKMEAEQATRELEQAAKVG
jgi:hypothetical protein